MEIEVELDPGDSLFLDNESRKKSKPLYKKSPI